ncbi:palmitoyltransferase [Saccharomycopsis crataegensis]|uniref:Palmitoyltransferase PFA4 n=1 Tax=Saccharomycopsis crataegensis TaxID=43959 RepID=A0AAV5QTA3_9ASCO|nr:palmitoyltransferase [Saccharomycopsis crataegensis]
MGIKLPHPALGVIVPACLIEFIGHSAHFFIFKHYFSTKKQILFECFLAMIWISYYIAIKKDPGQAPSDYKSVSGEWKRWCKKCEAYKPERTHHCKTCKKCVLKMDHHCPWTANCVGYKNMPHFMRFLFWVDFTTGFVFVELFKRGWQFWEERNYPAYMFRKSELVFLMILIMMDGFVFLSVGLLTLKCMIHITSGMSQIETWEWERVESQLRSERFWHRIRNNYQNLHGKPMPKLKSIRAEQYFYYNDSDAAKKSDHWLFSIDDIVFPYDIGFWNNIVDQLNYPWLWLLPWTGPKGDGILFAKTDLLEEDQLGLPWPPDGGHQVIEELDFEPEVDHDAKESYIFKSRKDLNRKEWINNMGEKLTDYGVDVDVEAEEPLESVLKEKSG